MGIYAKKPANKKKITIKEVFKEHFYLFYSTSKEVIPECVREQVKSVVTKMLECRDPEKGFCGIYMRRLSRENKSSIYLQK